MTDVRMLQPGIYDLIPIEYAYNEKDKVSAIAPLDPLLTSNAMRVDGDDEVGDMIEIDLVMIGDAAIAELDGLPGHLVIRVPIDTDDADGSPVVTIMGALTISDRYLLKPAAAITKNERPDEQYTMNWLSFEITGEQPLSVDGTIIRLGDIEIDPSALGDVALDTTLLDGVVTDWFDIVKAGRTKDAVHVQHVVKTGEPLHDILSTMPRERDDGVIVMLTFEENQIAEVEETFTDSAETFANEMRDALQRGFSHIVLRPAFDRARLSA